VVDTLGLDFLHDHLYLEKDVVGLVDNLRVT
jgi:hypothetical protein